MNAAKQPRPRPIEDKLLWIDPFSENFGDATMASLPDLLVPGDLLIVNDAATLPGSLRARTVHDEPLELRLLGNAGDRRWRVAFFGEGDWRTPTERRAAPPRVAIGDLVLLPGDARALVVDRSEKIDRILTLEFQVENVHALFYEHGRPVQYSYLARDLAIDEVQTPFSTRPWSVEMPSAGRPLSWSLLIALRRRGVKIASLTHAAGLSSIGDESLDRLLPLPERYEIPAATARAIEATKREGGRVIAVGTTVVRALEGRASTHRSNLAGSGETDLIIGSQHNLQIADGILSGVHEPGTSHYSLLGAFAPKTLLDSASAHAERAHYLVHEFGDHTLVLSRVSKFQRRAAV